MEGTEPGKRMDQSHVCKTQAVGDGQFAGYSQGFREAEWKTRREELGPHWEVTDHG